MEFSMLVFGNEYVDCFGEVKSKSKFIVRIRLLRDMIFICIPVA